MGSIYYKLSGQDQELVFRETTDSICRKQLDFIAGNLNGLQAKAQAGDTASNHRHDMASYIASTVAVKDKVILIQAYYLSLLP